MPAIYGSWAFRVLDSRNETLNEEEYEWYLQHIYGTHEYEHENDPLQEQLRDDDGNFVPGCYRTKPAPTG